MSEVYIGDLAQQAIARMPPRSAEALELAKEYLRDFPEMYPLITKGDYRGKRRIAIRPYFMVLYTVFGQDRNCFITDVIDARRVL